MANDNHYALLIGVKDYIPLHEGLGTLQSPHNDVTAFYNWLTDKAYGDVPIENCTLIQSTANYSPHQFEIDNALSEMLKRIEDRNGSAQRIYFYFSGHGLGIEKELLNPAFCLGGWSTRLRGNALSSSSYQNVLTTYQYFEEVVFIADCCRDTTWKVLPNSTMIDQDERGTFRGSTKLFTAYGCHYQQRSFGLAQAGQAQSVFTKFLIEGLKGAAAEASGLVTEQSLKNYLQFVVPAFAAENNFSQHPSILSYSTDNRPMVFGYRFTNKNTLTKTFCFGPNRRGSVTLFTAQAQAQTNFNLSAKKEYELDLPVGIYVLRDNESLETKLVMNFEPSVNFIVF